MKVTINPESKVITFSSEGERDTFDLGRLSQITGASSAVNYSDPQRKMEVSVNVSDLLNVVLNKK